MSETLEDRIAGAEANLASALENQKLIEQRYSDEIANLNKKIVEIDSEREAVTRNLITTQEELEKVRAEMADLKSHATSMASELLYIEACLQRGYEMQVCDGCHDIRLFDDMNQGCSGTSHKETKLCEDCSSSVKACIECEGNICEACACEYSHLCYDCFSSHQDKKSSSSSSSLEEEPEDSEDEE